MAITEFQFPEPANAVRPQPKRSGSPSSSVPTAPLAAAAPPAVAQLLGMDTFRLDSDLRLALEDMQQATGEPWPTFLEKAVNESLREWLGR